MKKIIMVLVSGVFFTSLMTTYATAQKATNNSFAPSEIDSKGSFRENSKIIAGYINDPATIKKMEANLKETKVSLKTIGFLNKNFKHVSDVSWSEEEKVIVARFKTEEKSARVVYNKKGHWLFTILTYDEMQMPSDVSDRVKALYNGFTISLVQEVKEGLTTVYIVHIEDRKTLKQVLVCNDEVTLYQDYQKGS